MNTDIFTTKMMELLDIPGVDIDTVITRLKEEQKRRDEDARMAEKRADAKRVLEVTYDLMSKWYPELTKHSAVTEESISQYLAETDRLAKLAQSLDSLTHGKTTTPVKGTFADALSKFVKDM